MKICVWMKIDLHIKGWALRLALKNLKKRPEVIRKWPIKFPRLEKFVTGPPSKLCNLLAAKNVPFFQNADSRSFIQICELLWFFLRNWKKSHDVSFAASKRKPRKAIVVEAINYMILNIQQVRLWKSKNSILCSRTKKKKSFRNGLRFKLKVVIYLRLQIPF